MYGGKLYRPTPSPVPRTRHTASAGTPRVPFPAGKVHQAHLCSRWTEKKKVGQLIGKEHTNTTLKFVQPGWIEVQERTPSFGWASREKKHHKQDNKTAEPQNPHDHINAKEPQKSTGKAFLQRSDYRFTHSHNGSTTLEESSEKTQSRRDLTIDSHTRKTAAQGAVLEAI